MNGKQKAQGYAVFESGGKLKEYEYELPDLKEDEASLDILNCGICHSDLSMINNEWGMTEYPLVPGHEIVGKVSSVGKSVKHVKEGDIVGIGWFSSSCLSCDQCMSGNHNVCSEAEGIIMGRPGGFSNKVNVQASWLTKIPEGYDLADAGPLFCGGLTVFSPIIQNNILPLSHVGVVGIGGLGHMALQFLNKWGCEVTAFSTSADKEQECHQMGAHNFVISKDSSSMEKLKSSLDMILVTINVPLDFDLYLSLLKPKGKLHIVGAIPEVKASFFPMLASQLSISSSPLGSPYISREMINFSARHNIKPITEHFKMSDVNNALEHLHSGKARYRIVLDI